MPTNLHGRQILDNTIAIIKLIASGTRDATTFLRGDGTYSNVLSGGINAAFLSANGIGPIGVYSGHNIQMNGTTNKSIIDGNSNAYIKFPTTNVVSAVNEITVSNSATGLAPSIGATGGDANIDLLLRGKGTGVARVNGVAPINTGGGTNFLADDGIYRAAGGASNLDALTDVTIVTPINGQSLIYNTVTSQWENATGAGTGNVVGPASATNNAFSRYDTTTGKLLKNSQTTEDTTGNVVIVGNLRATREGINKTNAGNAMVEILNNGGLQGQQIENDIATRIAFSTFVTADGFVRYAYLGDGKMEWGSGAVVADTNLYRGAANILTTDDLFEARGGLRVGTTSVVGKAVTFSDTLGNTTSSYRSQFNASVASQTGFAADTYLTGSNIIIPSGALKAKTMYRCKFNVVKTASGVATPIINIRFGTAGTTADTSRGTLTFSAQTNVVDEGTYELNVTFNTVGSATSAVIQSLGSLYHRLSVTGLGVGVSEPKIATSGGFDSTVANSIIGLSVNGGASAAWTVSIVQAELFNLV